MAGRSTTIKDDRFKAGNTLPKFSGSSTTTTVKPPPSEQKGTSVVEEVREGIKFLGTMKKRKNKGLDYE